MAKKLIFNEEMQKKLINGITQTADAVGSTLGPAGRTVMIQEAYGNVTVTKDGASVARSIVLEDNEENMGAQLIKQIATKTNDVVGDGTTTSTVLASALVKEGVKTVNNGVNPIDVRNGINMAVVDVIDSIENKAHKIGPKEEIVQIATISANDDKLIGSLIADAIEAVSRDGLITVNESSSAETYKTEVEGMEFDKGYLSYYFCTDPTTMTVEYEKPLVFICSRAISQTKDIVPVMEIARQSGRPLLIIADNVEGEALTSLMVNNMRGILRACAVKSPGFGDRSKPMLEDVAVLTGATVFDETIGKTPSMVTIEDLGSCDNATVTMDSTTIVGGDGTKEALNERIELIRGEIERATSEYDKEKAQERLAKLAGGVSVIYVGATTEAELKEKKHRVEDSINATRAAVECGIIPGGGATLCKIAKEKAENLGSLNLKDGEKIGYNIVLKALDQPIRQIAENAGLDGSVIADKCKNEPFEIGFDALNLKWGDMFDFGIIDPAKVTISALKNAASIASLVLTSSCMITMIPENGESVAQ